MPFQDYSDIPASNTTIGENVFIGPNMPRDQVRPALQQLAADGRTLRDEMLALGGGGGSGTFPPFQASGAGAVERTAVAKMRESVSVLDYIPTSLHAAIAAKNSTAASSNVTAYVNLAFATGRDVEVPAGLYMIDAEVSAKPVSNQRIIFEKGAEFRAIANDTDLPNYILLIEDVTNVLIEGGIFTGERDTHVGTTGESGMCIAIYGSTGVTVRDAVTKDAWGDGIYVGGRGTTGTSAGVMLDNCRANNCRRNGSTIAAVNSCMVIGGDYSSNGGVNGVAGAMLGIDIEPNTGKAAVTDVHLIGVAANDNGGPGLGAYQYHCTNITITDCTCLRNARSGIHIGATGKYVRVKGNTCNGNTEHGVSVDGFASFVQLDVLVADNDCHANTLDGISAGINVRRLDIGCNRVSHNGRHGISLNGTGGSYTTDLEVKGNRIWNNSQTTDLAADGIYIGDATLDLRVLDNWIRANDWTTYNTADEPDITLPTNRQGYGINSTKNVACLIAGNDVRNGGITANMVIQAANDVRANPGFRTENRVASANIDTTVTGNKTVTIAHGCSYTPASTDCVGQIIDTGAVGGSFRPLRFQSADATNVTFRLNVETAGSGNVQVLLVVERRVAAA